MTSGDPPGQVAEHGQPDQRRPGERLVGDRVGDLAEIGDLAALAGDVPVVPVGDRRDGENRPGDPPPGGVVPALGEQGEQEDRHQDQPQHGQRVGQIHQRHRWWRPFGHREATRQATRVGRAPRASTSSAVATRSMPSLPTTRQRTRSPGRRVRSAGSRRRRCVTLPSTSGAWCGPRPLNVPVGRSIEVVRLPGRRPAPAARCRSGPRRAARSAPRPATVTRSTRSAMTSSSSLSGRSRGRGAVLVRVAEYADGIHPGADQERLQFGQVVLGLAGEADDDVGADPGLRGGGPDLLDQAEERVARAVPAHPAQHGSEACWKDMS